MSAVPASGRLYGPRTLSPVTIPTSAAPSYTTQLCFHPIAALTARTAHWSECDGQWRRGRLSRRWMNGTLGSAPSSVWSAVDEEEDTATPLLITPARVHGVDADGPQTSCVVEGGEESGLAGSVPRLRPARGVVLLLLLLSLLLYLVAAGLGLSVLWSSGRLAWFLSSTRPSSGLFHEPSVSVPSSRTATCAGQLTSPVLAYWLGLPLSSSPRSSNNRPASTAVSDELIQVLDVRSVIAAFRADRRKLTLQIRQSQLERAMQTWLGSSTAALPSLLLQRLRLTDRATSQRVDDALILSASSGDTSALALFWRSITPPLEFEFNATVSAVTTLSLYTLVPGQDQRRALSSRQPFLLAVPRLDEPYERERSSNTAAGSDDLATDPFEALVRYTEQTTVSSADSVVRAASPSLRGTAAHLMSIASLPSTAPQSRSVLYANLSSPACAMVVVPHVQPRSSDRFPRWLDTGHGPDSLIASLNDDGFEFARSLDFVPVAHSDLSYPSSLSELPFPLPLMSDSWHGHLQQSAVLEAYEVEVQHTTPVALSWQPLNSSGAAVNVIVPVSVRIVVRVQPGVAVDFGYGIYASDVHNPLVSSPPARPTSSSAYSSLQLRVQGYVDYRNYEWNAELHHSRLQRESLPFQFASQFRFLPSLTRDGSDAVKMQRPLAVCSTADEPGYWAAQRSPLANDAPPSRNDTAMLPRTVRGMSYFSSTCAYRAFSWDEALSCLATRYPNIHWLGDSNSRRDVRTLYTAGRWLDAAFSCEENLDGVLAGTVADTTGSRAVGWPYPLPIDSPVLLDLERVHLRLPAREGEPLSANGTSGARLWYEFVFGFSGDNKLPASYLDRGPADLLILGLGSWEPMLFQWDLSTHPLFDMRRYRDSEFERRNVTRQLLDAADLIHRNYVLPNPNVTIVLRTAPATAEHAVIVDHRHYSHQRIQSFKRRIVRILRSSIIGERLLVWDVQQLYSYKLHALPSEDGSELCENGHVGPVTIRTELNVLFHALCPAG